MQEKTQGCLKLIFLRQKKEKKIDISSPYHQGYILKKITSFTIGYIFSLPYTEKVTKQLNLLMVGNPPPLGDFFKLNTNGFAQGNLGRASARGLIKGAWIDGFYISIGLTHYMAPMRWPCPHKKLKTFTSSSWKLLHNLLLVY